MAGTPEIARENGKKGGRPIGIRRKIQEDFTEEDIKDIVKFAKKKAGDGDTTLIKFILEQIYGKAPQTIDHTQGGGKELPTPILQLTQVNIKNNAILPDVSNK